MSSPIVLSAGGNPAMAPKIAPRTATPAGRKNKQAIPPVSFRFSNYGADEDFAQRHAELFYLQKQIQSQTPMVIVLEDGEQVEGQIEWYDRHTLKVRGRSKTLVYKSAIKYMYKLGEGGQ